MAHIPKNAVWYIADIIEEITVQGYKSCSLHINTVLIEASSPEDAFEKATVIGNTYNITYKNVYQKDVVCKFRGLQNLNVIDGKLEHGVELSYVRRDRIKPSSVERFVSDKADLAVFRDIIPLSGPNMMPDSIDDELKHRIQG